MNAIGEWLWYNDALMQTKEFSKPFSANANRIYEVIRIVNGQPLFLSDHFQRFVDSCTKLNIQTRLTVEVIKERILSVVSSNHLINCNIRFEEILEENYIVFACYGVPFSYPNPEVYLQGVSVGTYSAERPNPHIKQSVVNNKIREAIRVIYEKQKVYEVLLIDHNNCVTEGSRSNVFFVKNNSLVSPPSAGILEGITRKKVLEIALKNNIEVKEEDISIAKLSTYDACFLTGTSPKVLPVSNVNKTSFQVNHPLVLLIMNKYEELISLSV